MRRALITGLLAAGAAVAQTPAVQVSEGRLASGAAYRFEVPAGWNGQLLLYSRGYGAAPGGAVRAAPDKVRQALLSRGYALAAASYSRPGWALAEGVVDQIAAMDLFAMRHGEPRRTIAWGSSMGALLTVNLIERYPARFDGGLAMCGSVAGTLGMMNTALDAAWSFSKLQSTELPLRINGSGEAGFAQRQQWTAALAQARGTPQGRARLALAATLGRVPAWADAKAPRPPAGLDDAAVDAQIDALAAAFAPAVLLPRDDQETRAGGNFSWNEGVDYRQLLQRSGREAFVRAAYARAGADLDADLARLAAAPRVSADAAAAGYMLRHYAPSTQPARPLLLLQTTADPLTLPEMSTDYLQAAQQAGAGERVRAAWVDRLHHCNFEPGEVLAALQALQARIDGQPWRVDAATLNGVAAGQGGQLPAFVDAAPGPLLRPCYERRGSEPCSGLPAGARAVAARVPSFVQRASPPSVPPSTPVGGGPHPALMEALPALPQHTVYRPADLAAAGQRPLPVVAWANGGCRNEGNRFRWFLSELASHGYLVIAIGPIGPAGLEGSGEAQPAGAGRSAEAPAPSASGASRTTPAQLLQAIEWAAAENRRVGSPLAGRIASDRVAVMGQSCGGLQALAVGSDPRVRTIGVWNSGLLDDVALAARISGAPPESLTKDTLAKLRVPLLYVTGEPSDVAFANADDDFMRLNQVPVVRAWRAETPHGGTYREPGGGDYTPVALAWLRWQLQGDTSAASMFKGPDCGLCRQPGWSIRRKGLP
jgi:dienelactone hydrolase